MGLFYRLFYKLRNQVCGSFNLTSDGGLFFCGNFIHACYTGLAFNQQIKRTNFFNKKTVKIYAIFLCLASKKASSLSHEINFHFIKRVSMKKILFIFLVLAFILSACAKRATPTPTALPPPTATPKAQATQTPLPTVTAVCTSNKPTQSDIDRALTYTQTAIDELDWEKSYTVEEGRVSVTWFNNPQGAIIYLEARLFPCGYEEPDLNKYYSEENWQAVFQNYESYQMLDSCKTNTGLRLYEFTAQNQGFTYAVKYWVENDTETRIISTMMVFPLESSLLMDEYSARLFPQYKTCP